MDIKAKNNSTDVGKRINETKREIAQLNEELEKLLNSNLNKKISNCKDQETNKEGPISNVVKQIDNSTKTPNMGSNVNFKYSKRSNINITPINFSTTMDNLETLCKRHKSYNKESAKAYIKQQREKREEERKKLSSKSKIDQELRKQKLFELQQKSLELVHRNVQLSRERSKSRGNRVPIRMDKTICSNKTAKVQKKEATHYDTNTQKLNNASELIFQNDKSKNIQTKPDIKKYNNPENNPAMKSKKPSNENILGSNFKVNSSSSLQIKPNVPLKNITFGADNMNSLPYADKDLAATKIQAYYRGYQQRKKIKNSKSKPNDFIKLKTYPKESKETQTNVQEQVTTPVWLQVPSIDPYPCNFINTVKRKLQFVVNSVNSRDMGTQSSIIAPCSQGPIICFNKNEDNQQVDVKSRIEDHLISFNSHRYSNLDADALQHMVLFQKDKKTRHNKNRSTESESDTSKNITDITSEVALLPNHNDKAASISLEQTNNLVINTDKIRDLHLTDPSNRNKANSHTFTKILKDSADIDQSISKKLYTFNFYDEQNTEDTETSANGTNEQKFVRSPRDSILSFNKCNYTDESSNKKTTNISMKSNGVGQCVKDTSKSSSRRSISSYNICSNTHLSNSNIVRKKNTYETSDVSKIIENIENSMNTSLVSHISDNRSDTSCASSNKSKKNTSISTSDNFLSKKHLPSQETVDVLFEPPISPINWTNHMHLDDKNEVIDSIKSSTNMLTPVSSSCNCVAKKSLNSNSENEKQSPHESSQVKSSSSEQFSSNLTTKNIKQKELVEHSTISTECSHLASADKQFSQQKNLQNQYEVMSSSYSSNFCSENTDSLKKPDRSSDKNKLVKECSEKSKNENDPQVNNVDLGSDIINNLDNELETENTHLVKNINTKICRTKGDMNEIHLKFEAEVHLLNDFNESLKQFMAVEKAFESIKNKNEENCVRIQGRNSGISEGKSHSEKSNTSVNLSKRKFSSINLSRGSEIADSNLSNESLMRTAWNSLDNSLDLEISSIDENIEKSSITVREKLPNNLAGLSIKMFEQLIKDEDVRIENLKTILKIREQALLDRTKGELAWLEIQRKHLKETGRLNEASLVKKKQRGILLKHQQERREMQRLKQLQKMQSNERKTILKEQRNLIKAKLTSEKVMSDMKIHTPRKRQTNGPMKVLKTSGSIHSETSITKKTSDWEEILSITSKSQSIRLSEVDSSRDLIMNTDATNIKMIGSQHNLSNMKKALLMRQAALMERRKAVEDLLYRHQKLLEEEKKIEELEMAANALIMQMPTISQPKSIDGSKPKLKEKHLKENSHNTEILLERNFVENSISILQPTQNQRHDKTTKKPLKDGKNTQYQEFPEKRSANMVDKIDTTSYSRMRVNNDKKSNQDDDSVAKKSFEYSEDFELNSGDTVNDVSQISDTNENNLSSISELIQDFSKIEHGISMLSKQFEPARCSAASYHSHSDTESINEFEQSVIETTTMQHIKNTATDKDNLSFPIENIHSDSMAIKNEKFYSLLESSESEKTIPSISVVADPLSSIKEDFNNSLKLESHKFIEDETPIAEVVSHHSQFEKTPNLSTINTDKASETNVKDVTSIKQFDIGHDKTSPIESVTEVEERILSENSSKTSPEGFEEDETVDKSSIIEVLTKNSTKLEEFEEMDKEEPNSIIHSIDSTLNVNVSDCEKELNHNISETKTNESFYEETDILVENTDSNEDLKENSLKLEELNLDIIDEEKSSRINSISEITSLQSEQAEPNDIREIYDLQSTNLLSLNENISSEQTIDEDIPDLNNRQLDHADNKTSIAKSNDSCLKEDTFSKRTSENNSDASYGGIGKLFENELCQTSSNTTDISEKLYTDSEHLDIAELSPSDRSDNYTDDFEVDREGDSSLSSFKSKSEMENKKSVCDKDNEVLMMKIDLASAEIDNQANIVVMLNNKLQSQEKSCKNDNINDVCTPSKELSDVINDQNNSDIDTSVTEKELTECRVEKQRDTMKPEEFAVNVRERLSEIMLSTVDSPISMQDKDIHHQDYFVTTYEDITPVNSPESVSPMKSSSLPSMNIFGSEAEELLKKQIAIEQEIKHLEQQQKEHLPFVYMREIPNKPPPPYTPPSSLSNQILTILPSKVEDVTEICNYSAKVLYNAYLSNKLNDVTFSETDFKSINQTKSTKECCLFVFDLCREVVQNHYKKFDKDNVPYWLKPSRDAYVILGKPFDYYQLEKHINTEVKHLLGFEKKNIRENSVIRWSKKKKDHVDEILALEAQFEENEWLDYEKDELMVKNELTNEIFNVLLKETIDIYKKIFS